MKAAPAKWSRPLIGEKVAVSAAFAALCTAALAQVAANAPGVAGGDDPEYLHQLRVGLRRLLSAMRSFRPLLKRERAKAVARPLREAMQVFGAARDWDVFIVTLQRAQASPALRSSAERQRAGLAEQARAHAGSAEFQSEQEAVLRWLEDAPWRSSARPDEPLIGYARAALSRGHRKLHARASDIDWRDRERRHAVRIALKRLRYGCDFFAGLFPARAVTPFLRRLGQLQDSLGELNDIAVAHALLAELAGNGDDVRRWLARRERVLIASLATDWAAFQGLAPYWQPAARRGRRRKPRASASRA